MTALVVETLGSKPSRSVLPVILGSGLNFAYEVDAALRTEVVARLREFVTLRLADEFPGVKFGLRSRGQLRDEDDDSPPAEEFWLYCTWSDGPSIARVRAVTDACTRVEVVSPIPGLSLTSASLVHVAYGCHARSQAGWFALLANASPAVWEGARRWVALDGYRDPSILKACIRAAEDELILAAGRPAPSSHREREDHVDFDACSPHALRVGLIAAGLLPDLSSRLSVSNEFEAALKWFILEGAALAADVLAR